MTPDWLATEDGKKAVEAASLAGACDDRCNKPGRCKNCESQSLRRLTAALPHLDRMFRERYAKELDERAHKAGNVYKRNAAHAAAAFLRREPTL